MRQKIHFYADFSTSHSFLSFSFKILISIFFPLKFLPIFYQHPRTPPPPNLPSLGPIFVSGVEHQSLVRRQSTCLQSSPLSLQRLNIVPFCLLAAAVVSILALCPVRPSSTNSRQKRPKRQLGQPSSNSVVYRHLEREQERAEELRYTSIQLASPASCSSRHHRSLLLCLGCAMERRNRDLRDGLGFCTRCSIEYI